MQVYRFGEYQIFLFDKILGILGLKLTIELMPKNKALLAGC